MSGLLEKHDNNKHYSLLQHNFDDKENKQFNTIDTWTQCYKTFYVHNLQMFVIG